MSDYIVRGDVDKNIRYISNSDLYGYQFIVLLWLYITFFLTLFLIKKNVSVNLRRYRIPLLSKKITRNILLVAWFILALELLKRFQATDWSLLGFYHGSIAARGNTPWDYVGENIGDGRFVYAIVKFLLPFSGLIFAYVLARRFSLLSLTGFFLLLVVLISNGSRTPIMIVLFGFVFFVFMSKASIIKKSMFFITSVSIVVMATSLMYQYRSGGYENYSKSDSIEIRYHQDDSFYRALRAMNVSERVNYKWDATEFFVTTFVNPIPRYFWPSKPILLEDFWGEYKDYWVTITSFGEFVAMYGITIAIFLQVMLSALLYKLLEKFSAYSTISWGIMVYLFIALYVYMVQRSMFNIVVFSYLPVAVFLFFRYQHKSFK